MKLEESVFFLFIDS